MTGGPRQPALDGEAVKAAYRGWAPVYDYSFGLASGPARRGAVRMVNTCKGHILEVGVGTGLSLSHYAPHLRITGIDLSADMLDRALLRARRLHLASKSLALMDAGRLGFADASFDAAAVMFVMTVVPNPAAVLSELRRVLKPGGTAVVVNHFSRDKGLRALAERSLARFSRRLGWHPVFPLETVTKAPGFDLKEIVDLPPFGLFTLLRLQKKTS